MDTRIRNLNDVVSESREVIADHPIPSSVLALGIGVGVGLLITLALGGRRQYRPPTIAERMQHGMYDAMASVLPRSWTHS